MPDYLRGTHPQNHLTMHFGKEHSQHLHEDLIFLPALPIYTFCLLIQGFVLAYTAYETADQLDLPLVKAQRRAYAFPKQPHAFGTAPDLVVPVLSQLRWAPSGGRADQAHKPTSGPYIASTTSPRLMFLVLLCILSTPVPLISFGVGAFETAGWWALTTAVIALTAFVERSIWWSERTTTGLDGMRYNYKGA